MRPHPNIVRFYDAWMEPAAKPEGAEHCFILLEKCGETVAERVRCGGDPFTEGELLELLRQVTRVLHGDIASEQRSSRQTSCIYATRLWHEVDYNAASSC